MRLRRLKAKQYNPWNSLNYSTFSHNTIKSLGRLSAVSTLIVVPLLGATNSNADTLRPATAKQAVTQSAVTSNKLLKTNVSAKIKQNTIQYKGMDFPKLISTKSTSGSCCEIGTQRTVTRGSFAHDGIYRAKKSWNQTLKHEYFSPTCWVIDSGKVNISTIGTPASYSTSTVQSNLNFNTNSEYTSALNTLNNYVLNLNIPGSIKADLNAKIEEFVSNYQQVGHQLSSSHGGFIVTTIVNGTGQLNTSRAHSWVHGSFAVTETCCPPQFTDASALVSGLRAWVDSTVSNIKKSENATPIDSIRRAK